MLPAHFKSVSLSLRHIFLFDLAVIVCKRKGDNYEMKEIIDLQQYKIANNPTTDKENKKVNSWRFITGSLMTEHSRICALPFPGGVAHRFRRFCFWN